MAHPLDLDESDLPEQFVNDPVIADADTISVIGARQFLGTVWQRLSGKSSNCVDNTGDVFAGNAA